MIVKLSGTIIHHGVGFVVMERNGIGYKIIVPEDAAHGLRGDVFLFIHEVIRDDTHELFGFLNWEALELFWRLLAVPGVGPRSGQKIVYAALIDQVKENIMRGNLGWLMDIPGIGKKTAQKIILELKGVLAEEPGGAFDNDALEALLGLGYARRQAEAALAAVEASDTDERVKLALRHLGR